MAYYRALISVPITADSDDEATGIGDRYAMSLLGSGGSVVVGQLELLGEIREESLEIIRVVHADPWLLRQLPPDWKP
jgi:hypothetical protein